MTTIKGQHLRLFINNKCVAAAQTCTVHLAAQMQSSSSKDSTGDWEEQEVVGLSWDASTDALVVDGIFRTMTGKATFSVQIGGTSPMYLVATSAPTAYTLKPGEKMTVAGGAVLRQVSGQSYYDILGTGSYTNTGSSDLTVYVGSETENDDLTYALCDGAGLMVQDVLGMKGQSVTVKFSTTTGDMNREEVDTLLEGTAIVNDISVTAANRASSTFTVQLAGTGELEQSE